MPEFDIQQAKVFARPVIRSKIYTDPGNREIDISDRIISVGDISQNKTFLGYIDFQAGSNTALYKNTDDFLSFDKLVRLDDERCMVFRYHSGIYTKFIETEDIFPSTVENTDGTLFIAKFRFYALKFILNDFFLGAGSKSTDYAWYAYDVNSFDFQEISVSALDTEIIGGLAVNSDSNFFGKNNGIATWSNNTISNDLMFLQPGRTWGTMTVSYDGGTFTGYPIFLKQGTSTGFSAIPKVDKVYFSPGILFGKKYIGKKIIHQFKFDTMEDNELINIYVGKIETPTESFGVNSEKTIPIESGDIWNLFLENPLGKIDQNGNNRPYISGYKYITPIKVERYRYYNNIRYDIVYKFEIPEEYDWFNVVQVYYLDTNNVAKNVSYSLTTIENGIGYLYFTTEPPGQLLVLISNIPYVNGIRSIDSFTPIGQIRAIMFRACYDMLDVLRDYYNAPAENFLQIWGRLWDEDSYNIVRNSCNIYCSLQYSQKPVLEAISDLLNIYNGRLNFRIDSNFGKFYSDFYHPKMKSIFSITPKSLDQSNDYEKGVKYPAANRVKNSIKGYYMDSNILRNNGKENTKQKYEYTSDFSKKIFGIKSFGSDFDYSIDSDIVIDIGDLPYIDGMPIKTKRSEIHAAFNRKVGMLKSPPILYKFAINLKTIKINLGDLIIVSDKTGGMDDIELEVLNISYDPSGYKENAASCGTITAVKHGIGLEPGEVYIIETGNLFYNSKYVWY